MNDVIVEYDSRLDCNFLYSLYENDKEHAAIVFEQFLLGYPAQAAELEESFKAGDVLVLKQRIHKMKPTFSFVGLTALTEKAGQIEKRCADANNINDITDLYQSFKNDLTEFIPIVEAEFEKLKD
jgi:HPt (histidine-containing phosphotransfer) domain-containing protein